MNNKRIPDRIAPHDAEANEFRAAVRDVKPLLHDSSAASLADAKPRVRPRKPPQVGLDHDELMPLIGAPPVEGLGSAPLSYQRPGVRAQVMRRLRRGLYPTEDELDLHGLSQTTARDQLAAFIARNRESGHRCVRIIHGKGYRSGARGPVLKSAVNLWLRRHVDVMAFTSARAIDGGTGALYVLIRA
jgi:DNA-nicking Smr family endonuclease